MGCEIRIPPLFKVFRGEHKIGVQNAEILAENW